MKREESTNLTNHILSPVEADRLATNLNNIERRRERLNNPGIVEYVFFLIGEIYAIPCIIYVIYDLLCDSESALGFLFVLIVGLYIFYLDGRVILATINYILGGFKK